MMDLEEMLTNRLDFKLSYILHLIFKKFGIFIKKLFLKFSNLLYDYKKSCCQCKFLINCRFYDLIPTHISNSSKNLFHLSMHSKKEHRSLQKIIKKTEKRILNIEIFDINFHKKFLTDKISKFKNVLNKHTNSYLIDLFANFYNTKLMFIIRKVEEKLDIKLENLYYLKYKSILIKNTYRSDASCNASVISPNQNNTQVNELPRPMSNDKWLVNLSNIQLPPYVINILRLGDKFNFTADFNKKNILDIIKNLEYFLNEKTVDSKYSKNIRNKIINIVNKHNRTKFSLDFFDKKLKIDLIITKEFLSKENNLLVTRADKGNSTVVIEKQKYVEKMINLFSDSKYYNSIKKNRLP